VIGAKRAGLFPLTKVTARVVNKELLPK
jgi:hypothetical protein